MPVMDGVEVTRILYDMMRKCDLPNIPIIACTAFNSKDAMA